MTELLITQKIKRKTITQAMSLLIKVQTDVGKQKCENPTAYSQCIFC